MIEKRNALSRSEIKALSSKICSKILDIPAVKDSKSVGIYLSFRNEVVVDTLLAALSAKGKKVFVPVVSLEGKLKFARLYSHKETVLGIRGTREPKDKRFVKISELDALVIPGLAFDLDGFRVGWGEGYYDRFLFHNKKCVKIGAAYDFQIVKKIEHESHDIKMDFVVTEKRTLRF